MKTNNLSQDKKYAEYCKMEAKQLFRALTKLKIERDKEETVGYFLERNKIKQKDYEILLNKLYSRCEFLMMRYSDNPDIVNAYKELDGDKQAGWFFELTQKAFLENQNSHLSTDISHIIEEKYHIPTWTVIWVRIVRE